MNELWSTFKNILYLLDFFFKFNNNKNIYSQTHTHARYKNTERSLTQKKRRLMLAHSLLINWNHCRCSTTSSLCARFKTRVRRRLRRALRVCVCGYACECCHNTLRVRYVIIQINTQLYVYVICIFHVLLIEITAASDVCCRRWWCCDRDCFFWWCVMVSVSLGHRSRILNTIALRDRRRRRRKLSENARVKLHFVLCVLA